jgi:hypothetical protein
MTWPRYVPADSYCFVTRREGGGFQTRVDFVQRIAAVADYCG